MKAEKLRKILIEKGFENTFVLDNPDLSNAIIGITEDGQLVYSYEKMIDCLFERGDFTVEESVVFIDEKIRATINSTSQNKPIVIRELYGDSGWLE